MARATKRNVCVNQGEALRTSFVHRDGDAAPGRLIGYARVSTGDQNLALQIDALERAGCEAIFQDRGVSGSTRVRPGLTDAFAAMGPHDVLIVWRLDRLGRSLTHLVDVMTELERRRVGFASLTENIDTTSSAGRLVFHLMAALAEFERSLIAERTRAGLAAARSRGRRLGRPPRLSDEVREAAVVSVRLGRTVTEVAEAYGMHPRTLYRLLRTNASGRGSLKRPDKALGDL